jgi:hypothetical protein
MGVFVRDFPADHYGCSGVVVSKSALDVNSARNDILVSRCNLWKKIRAELTKHSRAENLSTSARLDDSSRQNLIRQLIFGEIKYQEVSGLKLITLANNTKVSFKRMEYSSIPITVSPTEGSRVADLLHVRKEALVLSMRTLEQFDVGNARELLDLLDQIASRDLCSGRFSYCEDMYKRVKAVDFDELSSSYSANHRDLKDSELDAKELAVLRAIRDGNNIFVRYMNHGYYGADRPITMRSIHVGVSDTAAAWTNGSTRITFNREKLKLGYSGIGGFHEIALIMLHEYVHDVSDFGSHLHDGEFYERFHEYAFKQGNPVSASAEAMLRSLIARFKESSFKMPRQVMAGLDQECLQERLTEACVS